MSSSFQDRDKAERKFGHLLRGSEFPFFWIDSVCLLTNERLISISSLGAQAKPDSFKELSRPSIEQEFAIEDIQSVKQAKLKSAFGIEVGLMDGSHHFVVWPMAMRKKNVLNLEEHIEKAKLGDYPIDLKSVVEGLKSREERGAEHDKGNFDDTLAGLRESIEEIKQGAREVSDGTRGLFGRSDEQNAQRGENLELAGKELISENFADKIITIYENGYVQVSKGLGVLKGTPEKLFDIWAETDVTKKSGPGRTAGAILTGGASLWAFSSQRGNMYLTISTDAQVHSFVRENPKAPEIRRLHAIVSAGKATLSGNAENHSTNEGSAPKLGLHEELAELAKLRDSGILSEEEFQAAKAKVIDGKP